ncbi:MAG: CoA transferase [Deltaproteobacteria bacterium]|nr:CoA transferase [Deltaproteobacteria bacterium]MBW2395408.1 CoA transferase [Deltaproteobacteria bacterium]
MSSANRSGPLAGIRVLDLTSVVSGPMCTQALGDLGADVIKLESPTGDQTRYSGAPFKEPLFSAMHTQMNRNKRSLVVDLKSEAGRDLVLDIISQIDVLVENLRPDVMDRFGLGYEALSSRHPGIVFASINGFGSDGPYASLPAYDQLMQGLVGVMPAQGGAGPPKPVQGPIADKTSALTAVGAILAALFARERDPEGRGQRVEVAMLDAYAAFALPDPMTPRAFPPDFEETGMSDAFFRAWETADGYVVGLVIQDHQFAALCRVLDRMDLVADPRFQEMGTRLGNYVELVATLEGDIQKWPSADFVARAREEGATFGPVNDVEAFLEDPQVQYRKTVRILEDERFGATRYIAPPWGFSRTPASIDRHAPRLGEHSDEVLLELGLDQDAIDALREGNAIG